jgi:hypothetical protein
MEEAGESEKAAPSRRFDNRTVIVTGGSRGIGASFEREKVA